MGGSMLFWLVGIVALIAFFIWTGQTTIWPIAATTLGEAIRRRVLLIIILVGFGFILIAPGLSVLQPRDSASVLKALGLGIIQLCGALIAIVLVIYTIPTEIERRTIYTILSKPVHRWEFILGKYLGAVMSLFVVMGLMGLTFVIVFWFNHHPVSDIWTLGSKKLIASIDWQVLKGVGLYFIQVSLLAAIAMMFSTFVSPLVNFFMSSGLYLVGNILSPFFDTIKENPGVSPFTKFTATVVHYILPNFANYNIQNPIIHPEQVLTNDALYMQQITLYGVVYIAILLVLAILVFDKREM